MIYVIFSNLVFEVVKFKILSHLFWYTHQTWCFLYITWIKLQVYNFVKHNLIRLFFLINWLDQAQLQELFIEFHHSFFLLYLRDNYFLTYIHIQHIITSVKEFFRILWYFIQLVLHASIENSLNHVSSQWHKNKLIHFLLL